MKRCSWVPAGGPTCEKATVAVMARTGSATMAVCKRHMAAYLAAGEKSDRRKKVGPAR